MKNLSNRTKVYLMFTYLSGALILIPRLYSLQITESVMVGVLCVLGSVVHILKVEGATNRSHYTFSFLIFGFAILQLDAPQALMVILVTNLAEWVWNRPQWFIQLFNIGCYMIAAQIAMLVYSLVNPLGSNASWQVILAIVLAMAGFTFINHLIIGVVVWLARGENFKQSGIFGAVPLLIDLTMLTVGASMALVWQYNPYALVVFLAPAYPLYMALRIPALERQTEIDQKTGLYNHQYFMTQFSNELQRANRYDRPLSVIIADLDLLRNINNTYGHLAGDEVLRGVADILRKTVRDYDIVARFGGEEFAILMPETEIDKALRRAEYIRKAIESARFVVPTSVEPIKATMSFGLSRRENFEQAKEEILHHADTALYRSKLSGRNRSLAYMNDSFLNSDATEMVKQQPGDGTADPEPPRGEQVPMQYSAASSNYVRRAPEAEEPSEDSTKRSDTPTSASENSGTAGKSIHGVYRYITILAVTALLAVAIFLRLSITSISGYSPSDWIGFAVIASIIAITEWFSINLYVRNTSLSTSAVPIITLVILFGPMGTLVGSAIFAVTAAVKFRSPFNRIVFNFSNHVIAGIIINTLILLAGPIMGSWKYPVVELVLILTASLILFICTTTLISIGIGVDHKQSPYEIWKEQYQWMAPYYLGIGFLAFALVFGYVYAGLLGILTMIIPLALLRVSQAQYVEHTRVIVNEIRQKNQELEKASHEINGMNEGLLTTLSEIIDLRDPYVLGHSKQVSKYASDIARLMGLNEKQIDLIRRASLLHDIGKLGISMGILTKPSRLTTEEYEIIKSHAALGGELVKNSPSLRSLVPIIRHHHEFFNGMGYPDKLSGKQISIEARIVAVADAVEAMTSDRPYRKALRLEQVIDELRRHSGTQFDPLVAKEAIRLLEGSLASEEASRDGAVASSTIALQFQVKLQTS
jgi:diguanylate cyclase (GGDEF)-like protein/putative nucleotidyltransferase with HDIG domain